MLLNNRVLAAMISRLLTDHQSGQLDSHGAKSALGDELAAVLVKHCGGAIATNQHGDRCAQPNGSSPSDGGIWNITWVDEAVKRTGDELEIDDLYTLVDKDGSSTHEYPDVKDMDFRHVWSVIEGDQGDLVCMPGFHVVNKIHYVVSEEPSFSDDECYPLVRNDQPYYAVIGHLDGEDDEVCLIRAEDASEASETATGMIRDAGDAGDDVEVYVEVVLSATTPITVARSRNDPLGT